jgi:hypothetical protein
MKGPNVGAIVAWLGTSVVAIVLLIVFGGHWMEHNAVRVIAGLTVLCASCWIFTGKPLPGIEGDTFLKWLGVTFLIVISVVIFLLTYLGRGMG